MARQRIAMNLEMLACLQSARLTLRQPKLTDIDAVFRYASDPVVSRFLAWPCHTALADSERFVQQARADWPGGRNLVWLIEDESGVVGSIGARISAVNAGIGYVLAQPCWGRGYATEALQLLSEALTRLTPLQMLWALCVKENRASARVLEKSGFHAMQTLKDYFSSPNAATGPWDVMIYRRTLGKPQRRSVMRRHEESETNSSPPVR